MRLIDVDKLGVGRCSEEVLPHDHCFAWNTLIGIIENAPTVDAVPVVRCKDCRYFNFNTIECENDSVSTDHEGGASYSLNFYLNDFCSYGERRDENE